MNWNKKVKEDYQDPLIAQSYDQERFGSFEGRIFDCLEKRVIKKALNIAQRNFDIDTVLDIPCGTGRITEVLLERRLHVTGGDISPEMISVARSKLFPRFGNLVIFKELDLDRLELQDSTYDLVSCIRLFHHLETKQRSAILRELARVSRKYVLVSVSYSSSYYQMRRKLKRLMHQGVSKSSSTWSEIKSELSNAGLQIKSTYFVLPLISEDLILLLEKENAF